ncbi:MAG TPA: pyruvate kinase alpha/beta domain-containing protein [Anaerolineae bacterium]|nr:pyruvate kinase alpha/beta domain-containing protein [Anaerolineae bacterium]
MSDISAPCVYFAEAGPSNTARTLELAGARALELGIGQVLVATTTGATGLLAAQLLRGLEVIVVTHSAGFAAPGTQELAPENRAAIEAAGARILTCQHAFGGVGRAVRKKLGTYELEEIVAFTLRTFGQGVKVAAEMALMAADAGLVCPGEPVIAVAGSGRGADTAVLLDPANAQTFFDLRFLELICMPSPGHP